MTDNVYEGITALAEYETPQERTYFTGEPRNVTQDNTPLGLEGDLRNVSDYVRDDSALEQLITKKGIKGVPVFTSYGEERGTRYVVPLRKGEILVLYRQPNNETLPLNSIYADELPHYFISYLYRHGKNVDLTGEW